MRTKRRFIIGLCCCVAIFFVLGIILDSLISTKIYTLLAKRVEQNKDEVDKLIQIENSNIHSYVNENSYWTELCTMIEKNDTNWVKANIDFVLGSNQYQADFLWIIDSSGKDIYKKHIGVFKRDFEIKFPSNFSMVKNFDKKTTTSIVIKTGGNYVFIRAASIVPSFDFNRETRPHGYLIVGKVIDSIFLKKLQTLNSFFKYSFVLSNKEEEEKTVNLDEAYTVFYKKINVLNENDLILKVKNNFPEVKLYRNFVRTSLFIYLLILATIIGFVINYFIRHFFTPLERVTTALETNSIEPLKRIKIKNTELGGISRLIETYFNQNKILQTEIQQRKKSEANLTIALDDIQKSTIDKIKAEQSAAAKSEFLSTMSHEIRTPINGVIGIANLLKDEKLTPHQKEYVDVLHFSANHLLSLVSDILDFSKIETGKVDFERSSFDLQQVCNTVYQLHKFNAEEKKIDFVYIPDTNLKQSIYGDYVRLNQVLTNLIGNAIKFTERGSVVFSYMVMAETSNNCTIQFKVKDTGIGIEENEQAKVFEGFSQANRNISKDFGGTGLGLTICKKLVELQGGKINVVSKYGEGAEFTFYISFEKHAFTAINNEIKPSASNTNMLNGMKVLVAEDNNINILVIKRFLEKWGISYKIALNGKEAVKLATDEFFDVILMDLHMPEMDGEEATKLIRNNEDKKINIIPIIALTANASSDTQNKLLSGGLFSNYISKPFNPDNLFKLLKKYYHDA